MKATRTVTGVVLLAFAAGLVFAPPAQAALEGYWAFNEGAGITALDSSGNGNNGTFGTSSYTAGQGGGAGNFALNVTGGGQAVTVPAGGFGAIGTNNQVTLSMWVFGDASQQPRGNTTVEGLNGGNRIVFTHLPWSDSRVYWDSGNTGCCGGNMRINYLASPAQYEGTWNHWTFVKNGTTDFSAIYLNGNTTPVVSTTGSTANLSGLTSLILAKDYRGYVDDVAIYSQAISTDTIAALGTGLLADGITYSDPIVGSNGYTKNGPGTAILTANNKYFGATTVSDGVLQINSTASLPGSANVGAGGTLRLVSADTTWGNTITGDGTAELQFRTIGPSNTRLNNITGFNGTVELTKSTATTGDKWNASNINAPNASVLVNPGTQLYVTGTDTFEGISVSGTGNTESRGAIRLGGTLNAPVTLLGNTTFGTEGGTLSGNITSGAAGTQTLTLGTGSSSGGTFSGVIGGGAGTIGVTVYGGTNTLSGAASNTYSGTTVIGGGVTYLGKTGGAYAISGPVQMGNGTSGQPWLRMSQDNQFAPGTVLTNANPWGQWTRFELKGTSQTLAGISGGTASATGGGVIQNSESGGGGAGVLTVDNDTDYLFAGHFRNGNSGTLSLIKEGSGTLTLASVDGQSSRISHTGDTTVNEGTLKLQNATTFNSNTEIANGATLDVNLTTTWNVPSITFSGTGTLVKSGAGTMVAGQSGITYVSMGAGGLIDIQQGVLRNNNRQGRWSANQASMNIESGGELWLYADNVTVDALTGTGKVYANYSDTDDVLFVGVAGGSGTFSGTMANGGSGPLNVTKQGAGTQTLSGTNINYTGATTIDQGQLILFNTPNYNSPTAVNSGTKMSWSGNGNMQSNTTGDTIALNNGGTLENLNPNNWTVINGAVTNSGATTINQTSNATGTGGRGFFLDRGLKGTGTVTINAANAGSGVNFRNNNTTFSGTMIVNGIASTTPFVGSGIGVGGCTTGLQNADITLNGTMEMLNQGIGWANGAPGDFWMGALNGSGVMVGNFTGGGETRVRIGNTNNNGTFSGIIADGTGNRIVLTKVGSGTQTLSGANTYTGGTFIEAGTISVGADANLGTGHLRFTGHGTLNVTSSFATNKEILSNNGGWGARSITIDVDPGVTFTTNGNLRTYSTDAANVYKTGLGTWAIGSNSGQWDRPLYVNEGTARLITWSAVGGADQIDINLANGTTLETGVDGNAGFVNQVRIAGAGTVADLVADRATAGAGTVDTFTRLRFDAANTLNVSPGTKVTSGTATIAVSGDTFLNGNSVINVNDSGAADMMLTLNTVTGTNRTLTIGGTGNTTIAGSVATGNGAVTKNGAGTLTLSGANTYTGTTTVNAGKLILAAGTWSPDSHAGGKLIINSGAEVEVTAAHPFGYWGRPIEINDGTVTTLTTTRELYVSGITMTGGTIQGPLDVRNWGGVTVNTSGTTATINSRLNLLNGIEVFSVADGAQDVDLLITTGIGDASWWGGTAGIRKTGGGTMEIRGNSDVGDQTFVDAGTLLVNGTLSTTGMTVADGATLGGTGSVNSTITGDGMVSPGASPGILKATAIDALLDASTRMDFSFEFTAYGSPNYGDPDASVNDVLWLTGATPFSNKPLDAGNVVDIYLRLPSLTSDGTLRGGFFTDNDSDFLADIAGATFNYYVEGDGFGTHLFEGRNYYTLDEFGPVWAVNLSTVAENGGYVMQLKTVPEPMTMLAVGLGIASLGGYMRKRKGIGRRV